VTDADFSHLAALHTLGEKSVPQVVVELAGARAADLIWRNELGGLTFRIGDQFVKWNPRRTGSTWIVNGFVWNGSRGVTQRLGSSLRVLTMRRSGSSPRLFPAIARWETPGALGELRRFKRSPPAYGPSTRSL